MGLEVFEPGQVDAFIRLLWTIGFSVTSVAFSVFALVYVTWWTPRKIRKMREYAFRPYSSGYQPDPDGAHPGPPPQGGSGVPRKIRKLKDGYTSGP